MPSFPMPPSWVLTALREGLVIPAHPLALTRTGRWAIRSQQALTRYYLDAGAGGLAVGVHTTQFAIRDPVHNLFEPMLEFTADTVEHWNEGTSRKTVLIAGICGTTDQAISEAEFAREGGYHAGLLSLGALAKATESALLTHCRAVAREIPLVGFYLQPAAGGRLLPYSFWRRFVEIPNVVAIKVAPFNRYQTIDVLRAVAESGRTDIALYTGNDDAIVSDLVTPFRFSLQGGRTVELRFVGGLLGQWAVWTRRAVELHRRCRQIAKSDKPVPADLLRLGAALTDANAALFDAAHGFAGCIPGIHEVLLQQGLLRSRVCLNRSERLSPGQAEAIARVSRAYPELVDDDWVRERLDHWFDRAHSGFASERDTT